MTNQLLTLHYDCINSDGERISFFFQIEWKKDISWRTIETAVRNVVEDKLGKPCLDLELVSSNDPMLVDMLKEMQKHYLK